MRGQVGLLICHRLAIMLPIQKLEPIGRQILMRSSGIKKLLLLGVASLWSCSEYHPPGYAAVADISQDGCPDLAGSYDLDPASARDNLLTGWLVQQEPGMSQLTLANAVGSNSYDYEMQMRREPFLEAADRLRQDKPGTYYEWRKLTLELLQIERAGFSRERLEKVRALGPLILWRGHLHSHSCNSGWVKVLEKETSAEDENGRYTREWGLWLGRDADGNLLLRTRVYRHKPGWTFWAAGGAGVRLIPDGDFWNKYPRSSAAISLADVGEYLPVITPPKNSLDCKRSPDDLVNYNQHLIDNLPGDVQLTRFIPEPDDPLSACNLLELRMGFISASRTSFESILRQLQQDPRVQQMKMVETRLDERKQWHFAVAMTLLM